MFEYAKPKTKNLSVRKPARPKGMQTMSPALWATIRAAVGAIKH
jgi:hypothetical protein